MAVYDRTELLQHMYNDIHKLCVVSFFDYAATKEADVFKYIERICGVLLAEAVKKQSLAEEPACSKKNGKWQAEKGIFAQAYLAPWPYDDVVGKTAGTTEEYSLTPEDKENGQRLYRALRKADCKKNQETGLSVEHIQVILEQVLTVLERRGTPEETKTQVDEIFSAYHVHLEKGLVL